MAEKTIRVYDGIRYKDITYEEIKDAKDNPTGRYKTLNEEIVTDLGTYLDVQKNYDKLQEDIQNLQKIKTGSYSTYTNRFCLFTDKQEKYYLIAMDYGFNPPVERQVDSWFNWVISILRKEEWYVNDSYEIDKSSPAKYIKFKITPKNGSSTFTMYLEPMDAYAYRDK